MFCSQCGRQIPDGSRFCNYCGTPIAVNDMNPDEKPEEEHYQDYGAFDAPKGFETLPYNKHGYSRETTNSQQTQVPQGGFVQKDYTHQNQTVQNVPIFQHSIPQYGNAQAKAGQGAGQNIYGGDPAQQSGSWQGIYGQSSYQQTQPTPPWQQDFATRPVRREKKWLLPVIIGAAVLLLALAAILFFSCGSDDDTAKNAEDPALQANLSNWGYACKSGEDYYGVMPGYGLLKAREKNLKEPEKAPDPELVKRLPVEIDGIEYENLEDLVPVGKRLYYQINGYDTEREIAIYRYCVYDTGTGREQELFTERGKFLFTLDKVEDRIYYCLDGEIFYIDTRISPEEGKACRKETGIRLGDDPNIMVCPKGFLVSEHGNCRGLKLVSFENETLRTYDKLKDQELYIHLVWNGYAYYHREDVEDKRTIYRINLATGEPEIFATQESMDDPLMIRMNAYEDRIFVGVMRDTAPGINKFGIMEFYENGELRLETRIPDAPEDGYSLLCMVNVGKYMITRLVLLPDSPTMHIYTLPDMMMMQ